MPEIEEPTEGTEESTESQTTGTEPDDGEDDVTKVKRQATHWQREAKKKDKTLTDLQAELERLREANQTEAEKAIEASRKEARKEAESEWKGKWQRERVTTEAMRVMNGRVSDPRLAFPLLDLDAVLDDDGEVDPKALKKAVDDLIEEYPSLALADAPSHHMDLGPKRTAKAPQNMNDLLRRAAGRV